MTALLKLLGLVHHIEEGTYGLVLDNIVVQQVQ